jgi:hypothetical protein
MSRPSEEITRAVNKLDALDGSCDCEAQHTDADEILLGLLGQLGAEAVRDAYMRLVKRSKWWAFA